MAAAASDTAPAGDFLEPTFFRNHDRPAVARFAADARGAIDGDFGDDAAAENAARP